MNGVRIFKIVVNLLSAILWLAAVIACLIVQPPLWPVFVGCGIILIILTGGNAWMHYAGIHMVNQIQQMGETVSRSTWELANWYETRTDNDDQPGVKNLREKLAAFTQTHPDPNVDEMSTMLDYMRAIDTITGEHHAGTLELFIKAAAENPGKVSQLETAYRREQQRISRPAIE